MSNRVSRYLLTCCAVIIYLQTTIAVGHQLKTALTEISLNQNSNELEVSHRFYLHDAEQAVKILLDPNADLLGNTDTGALFSEYVSSHFSLTIDDGSAHTLAILGHENDGKYFWVYQTLPIQAALHKLAVSHSSLQEIWPSQINLINVELGGVVKSLTFDAKETWQHLYF